MKLPTQQSHVPAVLPRTHIPRIRLLRKLSQAVQCRLTVVCANAGYGKTTLLREFSTTSGVRLEWHSLSTADRDVARLSDGLEKALRRLAGDAEPARAKRARVRESTGLNVAIYGQALRRQAERLGPESCILVLDDYHKLRGSQEAELLLTSLIEDAPSCLHFVILSRTVPNLPLPSLMARQELFTLAEEDLAFTLEEATRFLRGEPSLALEDTAVALMHERTEGWAAGLAMVLQSLRFGHQDRVMSILTDPVASVWLVYDYLAEEVFDKQEAAVQDFLVKTSVLEAMAAPACDNLLGSTSSQVTLLALEEGGLFTNSLDSVKRVFRYHHLFREFLREKLYQRESREAIEALHLRAAEYYRQEESWDECVRQYLKGGDPVKAAQVVEAVGERYIYSGFSRTLDYWLRVLPQDLVATRPWLLGLKGLIAFLALKPEASQRLLEQAIRLFQFGGDTRGQAWAAGEAAYGIFRSGRVQKSLAQFDLALCLAPSGNPLRSQLLTMRSMAYQVIGRLDESIVGYQDAIRESAAIQDEVVRLWAQSRALRNLAMALMDRGDLEEACSTARESLDLCVSCQIGEHEEIWSENPVRRYSMGPGAFDESIEMLRRTMPLCGEYAKDHMKSLSLWLGNALRDSGQHLEADQTYARTRQPTAEAERLFLKVLDGRARSVKLAAVDVHKRARDTERMDEWLSAEMTLAAALGEVGALEEALEHVLEAIRLADSSGYVLRLASAKLHQAYLEYRLTRLPEAIESLRQALRLASDRSYYHFHWWDPQVVAFLCREAVRENLYVDYVLELARQRLGADQVSALTGALPAGQREVSRQEGERSGEMELEKQGLSLEQLLAECTDLGVRSALAKAAVEGVVTAEGIRVLRAEYGLSWREAMVMAEYYLRPHAQPRPTGGLSRKECAQRMFISEHTLRCQVNSLRSKLELPPRAGGEQVYDWAAKAGLLPSKPLR